MLVNLVPVEVARRSEDRLADIAGEVGRRAAHPVPLEVQKVVEPLGSFRRTVRAEENAMSPHVQSKVRSTCIADLA